MTIELMMLGVLIVSALTGLATEAVKKLLDEYGKSYHSNMLAGCIAVVISLLFGVGYGVVNDITFDATIAVYLIALIFLGWLCAMVGYDKVKQTVTQILKG